MIRNESPEKSRFSPDAFFRNHPRWYIAGFLLFSLVRIIWTSDRGVQHNLHDALLYLECAKHIVCGNWLGPLHVVTLGKTCLFPLFISLSLISGISYLLMVDLCRCLAALLAVGIMWPGTISLSSRKCPAGETAMFAFLASAGDLGATAGPVLVGKVAEATCENLKNGLPAATIFPVCMTLGLFSLYNLKSGDYDNHVMLELRCQVI